MPGSIIGLVGKQRSGKTLMSYLLAKSLYQTAKDSGYLLRCYSNLYSPEDDFMTYISSISEIPLDLEPKIVLIDEIYNGCDSQDYKKLKDISIFLNTIGKQNCLFLYTTIEAGMVYNRFRNQTNTFVLVKKVNDVIFYRFFYPDIGTYNDLQLKLTPELFASVHYDTNFIPVVFDWRMDTWNDKLQEYYRRYYPDVL